MFDRKAYAAFTGARFELRQARLLLSRISAQDEFAKWAKQRRLVDKLTSEFESTSMIYHLSFINSSFNITYPFRFVKEWKAWFGSDCTCLVAQNYRLPRVTIHQYEICE